MTYSCNSTRHGVLKAGTIGLGGGWIDCIVRNLSVTGATLEVEGHAEIPETFTLGISADKLLLLCHVVLRSGRGFGVAFEPDRVMTHRPPAV